MCSKMVFDYKIVSDSGIEVSSSSVYDEGCGKGNERNVWEALVGAKTYRWAEDGTVTLIDGKGKETVTLNMQ
jgi:hypothetical protein